MKKANTFDVDDLASGIIRLMQDYVDLTSESVKDAVEQTAKAVKKDIVDHAPVGDTKSYKRSWRIITSLNSKTALHKTVCSLPPHYRRTHLLEKGHALRRGGRKIGEAKAYPHIAPAEERGIEMLEDLIMKSL